MKSLVFTILFLPYFLSCQPTNNICSKIKKGRFYYYPSDSNGFLIIRDDDFQREINLATGDTSYWNYKWKSDCIVNTRFIRNSGQLATEELPFSKSQDLDIEVIEVKKNFYVFKILKESFSLIDTIWFNQRKTLE